MSQTRYVLGFAFTNSGYLILLQRKHRPKWQKGKLNGVGGHIEENESPLQAMVREFEEETGVATEESDWEFFCKLFGKDFCVFCYATFSDEIIFNARSTTDEEVKIYLPRSDYLNCDGGLVSNLYWLLPMAFDRHFGNISGSKLSAEVWYGGQAPL